MLNNDQLDSLIDKARQQYNAPPTPDLDQLWERIEARRLARRFPARSTVWWQRAGIAAAVVAAFALGRVTQIPQDAEPVVATAAADSGTAISPVASEASDLLGQTVVLLSALPADTTRDSRGFARQAGELLLTTRLLLDAPGLQRNPALTSVLRDLELVLAQVARLHNGEARDELELITDAMRQQDLVPRIRTVAAGLQAGAD